jgi:WD40 repeat protein
MDAAASAPQAGYDALVRQLSRQLSLSSESDDAPVNLADLPAELLALILYHLLLAHDIARAAKASKALKLAAELAFAARPYSPEVRTLRTGGFIKCVAAADDGHVLTGLEDQGEDRTSYPVKVWRGDELVRTIEAHTREVTAVAVLPGGARFVSVSEDGTAKLFTFGGELERTFEVGGWVDCVAALPDGVHFVVGSREVRLYHVDGTLVHTFKGHTSVVYSLAVMPDGHHIVSGSMDHTVKVWSVATKSLVSTCGRKDNKDPSIGHNDDVMAVAPTPDGQRILSGGVDQTVRVWLLNGALENTFQLHTGPVRALVALPDNQHALSGSADKTVKLFNVNHGAVLRTFKHHTEWLYSLALLPDGLRFASGASDGVCIVYHGLAPL